jgi:hypothetical protein
MRTNCQKVFTIFYMGVMVVGQILTLVGIYKDDKNLIVGGASIMLADNIFYIGKLVADGVYDQPNGELREVIIAGDHGIEMVD